MNHFVDAEKQIPMRVLKITTIVFSIGALSILCYANLRTLSPTEKLKKVNLASFLLKGNLSAEEKKKIEEHVNNTPGVTACSLNAEGNTATVIFYPDHINESAVAYLLSNAGKITVTQKQLSTSGGCPIPKITASMNRFISALDFRD